jgi:hypothetical protein
MGVYITPSKSKIIVAGIYGPSANDDTESQSGQGDPRRIRTQFKLEISF